MVDIRRLINAHKNILCEFYEVSSGDVLNMHLDYLGIQEDGSRLFELDGIQFYQVLGEDLDNAIEVCIDEEFMPNWNNYDVSGYVVEDIDYEKGDDSGTVTISVY